MKYTTTLRKSGNAQVFPLSAAAIKELGVELGTEFSMTIQGHTIVLERAKKLPTREEVFAALEIADLSIPEDIRDFQNAAPIGKEIF